MTRGQIGTIVVTVMAAMIATAQSSAEQLGLSPQHVAMLAIVAAGLTAAQMFLPKLTITKEEKS